MLVLWRRKISAAMKHQYCLTRYQELYGGAAVAFEVGGCCSAQFYFDDVTDWF
ncbi:Uncharacterised protein [Vibrio cholerae]|nr:Uncharacterised protein [Vibrio cholerae]CSD10351.1 Uncharacterised protein [Vibrio cholerae]